ncbi:MULTISPECIES: phycobilisome degradation protein NblB [Okeania]|uniref:HEAT repeat domain-containing protein n=1 Tax=Okeania hirsuta TaxID=1458930 RepID=A0A3N6P2G1_9CYAN|nr:MULTISPECIES: HEAT repeat domain-containing protein [Okeania]NET12965.1 HEAT repeat domain-containing protein [Okeania sp. SIO1H6]NES79702.1 HEAT repeat domain-containing protein [Okeania sp. SIO1H4]NES91993.1 HEAT repeat domain-containing protein [Okeania sp. SIO2B9]NET23395.1 HEAT repeat domain-containing protein [Okeania sp. SIO1H5]NET78641.1 HEAT repeat domain-containing protein [Okeania sp. SIO1F9]
MSVTPDSIKQLLISEDLGDRLRGVNQLRQIDLATAFELIQTSIKDQDTRVRYAAVSQMSSLGTQNLTISQEILRDCLLNDPEPDVQAAAADALGALKLTETFDDLQQVYQNTPEWLVKMSIVAVVGGMGEPRALSLLKDALQSDNELIQTIAISALGELGNPEAVPFLTPFATNSDWQMRYRLVQALHKLGGPQAEQVITQLANDPVEQVAQEAKVAQNS